MCRAHEGWADFEPFNVPVAHELEAGDSCNPHSNQVSETQDTLQIDVFEWRHSVTGTCVRSSLMVDDGTFKTVVLIHRTANDGQGMGNSMHEETLAAEFTTGSSTTDAPLVNRSDPKSNYRIDLLWDLSPAEARWRTGTVEATIKLVKTAAMGRAPRPLARCSWNRKRSEVPPLGSTSGGVHSQDSRVQCLKLKRQL